MRPACYAGGHLCNLHAAPARQLSVCSHEELLVSAFLLVTAEVYALTCFYVCQGFIRHHCALAARFAQHVRDHPSFELTAPPRYSLVCFAMKVHYMNVSDAWSYAASSMPYLSMTPCKCASEILCPRFHCTLCV